MSAPVLPLTVPHVEESPQVRSRGPDRHSFSKGQMLQQPVPVDTSITPSPRNSNSSDTTENAKASTTATNRPNVRPAQVVPFVPSSPSRKLQHSQRSQPSDVEVSGDFWESFWNKSKEDWIDFFFPVFDPRSSGVLTWDALVMFIVLYSTVVVSIEVGFPTLELPPTWKAISLIADALFLLDVLHNFFVGYYNEEEILITNRKQILRRYLLTWFLIDIIAILPTDYPDGVTFSWPDESQGEPNGGWSSLKLVRLGRLIRVTKFARLIKMRRFATKVEDLLDVDGTAVRLTQLIGQSALVTHMLTCFWHYLGWSTSPLETTWINFYGIADQKSGVRYLYSFYWVISTLAGVGFGDIHATNSIERVFSIVVAITGASGFGVIVGHLTSIMENWNRETNAKIHRMAIVKEFLKKKRLPKSMATSVLKYFRQYIAKTTSFQEGEILGELSLTLRGEVLRETHRSMFLRVEAFKTLNSQFVLDMLVFIKPTFASPGDVIACQDTVGKEMYILAEGIIEVHRAARSLLHRYSSTVQLQRPAGADQKIDAEPDEKQYIVVLEILTQYAIFGESSMLNYSVHQNSYVARGTSDLFTLAKEDFDNIIEMHPEAEQSLLAYHKARYSTYEKVYHQTLERYRALESAVQIGSGKDSLSLEVVLDGVLLSYRDIPMRILRNLTLELSMGMSVFNSPQEKAVVRALMKRGSPDSSFVSMLTAYLSTPIDPQNYFRLVWDFWISILLLYCAAVIPFEVTFLNFDSEENSALTAIEIFIEVVFGLDIIVNFRTALVDARGELITSNRLIVESYLRFWFWIDLLSTLPLGSMLPAGKPSGANLVRIIRLLKFSRLIKLTRLFGRIVSIGLVSHSTSRVAKLLLQVVFSAHLLGCGYYFASMSSRDYYEHTIIDKMTNASLTEKYIITLYWAVTTMTTVGFGDVTPQNPLEVAYVCFSVIVGATVFTYIVGTLSGIVEDLQLRQDTILERLDRVKGYLRSKGISAALSGRVRRYYEYYLAKRDDENDEAIVAALSDGLRTQVVLHLNRDIVSKISFFASQSDDCVSYLMGILSQEFCTAGEFVFKEGQVGRHMYFLVKGIAEVVLNVATPLEHVVLTLKAGSYFGEIAMLTSSKRAASVRAKSYISLYVLSRSGFEKISLHYPEMANNILGEFRKNIKQIKKSQRKIAPLIAADLKKAREQSFANRSDLQESLQALDKVINTMVRTLGGGEKGKKKALSCVVQYLHKYEFSLNDFLNAAEEVAQKDRISGLWKMSMGIMAMNVMQRSWKKQRKATLIR